ncbi:response regulator [Kamptonema cortianum]|nr:response regulator [Kamptonema cortianum]
MPKLRVLIADDSVVVRRLVSEILSDDEEIEVIGTAANGKIAVAKAEQTVPDAVVLDVEMPDMDGLQALSLIRGIFPMMPVIMFSTLTERGATATLEALSLGANDYVTKPANVGGVSDSIQKLKSELIPKIKLFLWKTERNHSIRKKNGDGNCCGSGAHTRQADSKNSFADHPGSCCGHWNLNGRPQCLDRIASPFAL